ncbi:ion channel [uncultured Jannaschia sp.]|uniref:ion channel n=1 Tax=uncultured Jannaschia sp. TaxID=293347 RepID=UPI0026391158|nr:ion channel [uncultured Jannaschia sp.]
MTFLRRLLLPLLLLPLPALSQTVSVGVIDAPPFAIRDRTGVHTGLAVDLFRLVAERAEIDFEMTAVADDPVAALADHDIVLPVEADRALEAAADLTHPVYTATLGYASKVGSGPLAVVRGLMTLEFLRIIASVAVLLLVVGAVVWLIERRRNTEMFREDARRGLGDGFWWAGVTLTTIGYGDKAPVTVAGRAVAMLWMLTGLAVSASLTAAVVTLAGGGGGSPDLPEALSDRSVVVIEGSAAQAFLDGRGVVSETAPDAETALRLVETGGVDVAVGAAPILQWQRDRAGHDLRVRTTKWDPVLVTMAVAEGDALRERLDRALLDVLTSEAGQELVRRYLPDEEG